jgi:hypothetical protein
MPFALGSLAINRSKFGSVYRDAKSENRRMNAFLSPMALASDTRHLGRVEAPC